MIELLEHNKSTFETAQKLLKEKKKVGIVQATATGKSFITMKIIDEMFRNDNVLFVVPYKSIEKSITSYKEWDFDNVEFTTYSSLSNTDITKYNFIVLDEAHHCLAPVWKNYIKPLFNMDCYILGMTATEVRGDSLNVMKELFNDCTVYGLQLENAVEQNILPDSDYIIYDTTVSQRIENVKDILNDEIITIANKTTFDDVFTLQISDAINKYINLGVKKWIVFHQNKDSLKLSDINNVFPDDMKIFYYVSGMKQVEYDSILKAFIESESAVINSVNMLNEGVHIKGVTGIIMLRHTESNIIFKQQIGRILSPNNVDKVSVIIDAAENYKNLKNMLSSTNGSNITSNRKFDVNIVINNFIRITSAKIESILSILEEYEEKSVNKLKEKPKREIETISEYEISMIKKYYPKYGMQILNMVPTLNKNKISRVIKKYKIKFKGLWSFDDDMKLIHGLTVEGKTQMECEKRLEYLKSRGII